MLSAKKERLGLNDFAVFYHVSRGYRVFLNFSSFDFDYDSSQRDAVLIVEVNGSPS